MGKINVTKVINSEQRFNINFEGSNDLTKKISCKQFQNYYKVNQSLQF